MNTPTVTVQRVSGPALQQYIPALAELRIAVFREFPYLYDGSLAYEKDYLGAFAACPTAVIVLALDGERVVGAATGLPLAAESAPFRQPLERLGHDPSGFFYCAESVLLPAWRGRGLGHRFFVEREAHARTLGGFGHCCFCAVERPANHPLRPPDYRPLDAFWTSRGYRRQEGLTMELAWKDIDQAQQTTKTLTYWIRALT